MVDLPIPPDQEVIARAPQNRVSGYQYARSGSYLAEGMDKLGQGLDAIAVPMAQKQAATDLSSGAASVTRDAQGNVSVNTPNSGPIFGAAGANYQHAIAAGQLAQGDNLVTQDIANLRAAHEGDPEGFRTAFQAYQQKMGANNPTPAGQALVQRAGNLGSQYYGDMVQKQATVNTANSKDAITSVMSDRYNTMAALAEQSGTDTPAFMQAKADYLSSSAALTKNPAFGISADVQAQNDKAAFNQLTGYAISGQVDRDMKDPALGMTGALANLQKNLNDPALNLSPKERTQFQAIGEARVQFNKGQNESDIAANRLNYEAINEAAKNPTTSAQLSSPLFQTMMSRAVAVGDTDSAKKIGALYETWQLHQGVKSLSASQMLNSQGLGPGPAPVVPPAPSPAARAAGMWFAGDSVADGLKGAAGPNAQGDTFQGRSPSEVLASINNATAAQVSGKTVMLSSGASNAPGEVAKLGDQIDALKKKGAANVIVEGVGDRQDFQDAKLNDQIAAIAKAHGAQAAGPIDPTNLRRTNDPTKQWDNGVHAANWGQELNRILGGTPGAASSPGTPAAPTNLNWSQGSGNAQQPGPSLVEKSSFLMNVGVNTLGATPQAAAAMVGNTIAESSLKTSADNEKGESSHGLFQWNEAAGRWQPFLNWAQANGMAPNDPAAQMQYAKVEAQKMPMNDGTGRSVWDAVNQAKTSADANHIWLTKFESPADQSQMVHDWRQKNVDLASNAYAGGGSVSTAPSVHMSANGTPFTDQQIKDNPYVVSSWVNAIARDPEARAGAGRSLGETILGLGRNGSVPPADTLAQYHQLSDSRPELAEQRSHVDAMMEGYRQADHAVNLPPGQGQSYMDQVGQFANGPDLYHQEVAQQAKQFYEQALKATKEHPWQTAVAKGWDNGKGLPLPITSDTLNDPQQLAVALHQRDALATSIANRSVGDNSAPALAPDELNQIKSTLANGSAKQIGNLQFAISTLPEARQKSTLAAIGVTGGDGAVFSVAGTLRGDNPQAADDLWQGHQIMKDKEEFAPKSDDAKTALDKYLPPANYSPDLRDKIGAGVAALYAKMSADANDATHAMNSDRYKAALDAVTGGIVNRRGASLSAPWYGASQADFNSVLSSVTENDLKGSVTKDGSPLPASAIRPAMGDWLTSGGFKLQSNSVGDGKYRIYAGPDNAKAYVKDANGQPFLLDLGAKRDLIGPAGAMGSER